LLYAFKKNEAARVLLGRVYKPIKIYVMKKLGILAIGTLLFFAVSCNKDKNSYAPDMNSNGTYSGSNQVKNATPLTGADVAGGLQSPTTSSNKIPKITDTGVRNGENINSNTGTEKTIIVRPIRDDMNNPYNNPSRLTKGRVRNDMQNPDNDPR
jgi:hypothetical protein